jgi:hypothetical protein
VRRKAAINPAQARQQVTLSSLGLVTVSEVYLLAGKAQPSASSDLAYWVGREPKFHHRRYLDNIYL